MPHLQTIVANLHFSLLKSKDTPRIVTAILKDLKRAAPNAYLSLSGQIVIYADSFDLLEETTDYYTNRFYELKQFLRKSEERNVISTIFMEITGTCPREEISIEKRSKWINKLIDREMGNVSIKRREWQFDREYSIHPEDEKDVGYYRNLKVGFD